MSKKITVHGKEVTLKGKHNMFKHKCTGCGQCCINSKPKLNPYDILILSKKLKISMAKFLQKYAYVRIEDDKFPTAYLKTSGSCPFLENNRCSVYEFRPFTCRLFPLGVYQNSSIQYYYVNSMNPNHAKTSTKVSIEEFLSKNLNEEHEEIAREWTKFKIILRNSKAPCSDKKFLDTLFRVLYLFDEPDVMKGMEKMIGRPSEDYIEFFFQAMEFAERWLLKPYVIEKSRVQSSASIIMAS